MYSVPVLPRHRSTGLARGLPAVPSEHLRANTTEAGTGKKLLGSSRSKSHAGFRVKSTSILSPDLPSRQRPVRHLEYCPACKAL